MELQLEGRNVEIRASWQAKVEEEKNRIDRHHAGLVHHLRITVESTSQHREGGFEVRTVASVPNDTVVVKRRGDNVRQLLTESFDVLGGLLKEFQRKRRQTVKVQEDDRLPTATGEVKSLFPFESYGFISATDGREIYFHENALKDLAMGDLAEGMAVRYAETEGEKGPAATWVRAAK